MSILTIPLFSAWNGFNHKYKISVQIDNKELVRLGKDISYMDELFNYHRAKVIDIERTGGNVDVYIYDYEKKENLLLVMDED